MEKAHCTMWKRRHDLTTSRRYDVKTSIFCFFVTVTVFLDWYASNLVQTHRAATRYYLLTYCAKVISHWSDTFTTILTTSIYRNIVEPTYFQIDTCIVLATTFNAQFSDFKMIPRNTQYSLLKIFYGIVRFQRMRKYYLARRGGWKRNMP